MSKLWRGLDGLIPLMRKYVAAALPPDGREMTRDELKFKAAVVAEAAFGPAAAMEHVGSINMAVLALMTNAQPPTWLCRPSASRVIHRTDLHSIPTLPPRILRAPGVIEVRRPATGERLWGDFASLGWYAFGDQYWLLGLQYPDGYMVAHWRPQWTGEDLDDQLPAPDPSALVPTDRRNSYQEFALQAARYLVVLGLLAEADPSPLRIVLDKSDKSRKRCDVYLDEKRAQPRPRDPSRVPLLDGRHAVDVDVTGHLKRQRYGEGNVKVKWIYVHGFSARRWVSPRWSVFEFGTGEI